MGKNRVGVTKIMSKSHRDMLFQYMYEEQMFMLTHKEIYMYINKHINTHTHIYVYIYITKLINRIVINVDCQERLLSKKKTFYFIK